MNSKLKIWNSVVLVMYGILLAFTILNTVKFVYKQRRFENLHISYFYVLVYMIIAVRVMWLSFIIAVVRQYDDRIAEVDPYKFKPR